VTRAGGAKILDLWERELKNVDPMIMGFLSATSNQLSREDKDLGHGIFTAFVLKGMRGEAVGDKNGVVRAGELYKYLVESVPAHSLKKYGVGQTPTITPTFDDSFALARPDVYGSSARMW
jgi:uncharacterized caspase-like protein